MAMPSMSRPRSGHDMDILKSILGSSSDHSSTGDKSPTKTHSRTNSSSSSSSSTKPGIHNKSEHDDDSSCSDSESRTESQRDRSSSIDEKSHSLRENKCLEGNDLGSVIAEDQTKNCKKSEMDSVNDSELGNEPVTEKKKKRRINKKRKVHLKRQKNVELQKCFTDNKESEDVKNDDINRCDESAESQQQDKYKCSNNSLSNSQSSIGDDHSRRFAKPAEPKHQHKQQHLSKRAQRTLRLYPERYGDPDRLKHNYEELQQILQSQFIEDQHSVNEELVKETKRVLDMYHKHQAGYSGQLRPPPGVPSAGRRVRRIRSATRERSPAWTQTDLTADQGKTRPQSAKGYYFIDTTKADQSKRVTFVQIEDDNDEEEGEVLAGEDEDKQKFSTYTVSIQLNKPPACQSSSEPERGRVIKKITRRPKSASCITEKKKPLSRSLSPHVSPSHKITLRRMSESSTSRSRSSHSRSPSIDRKQTDNHLENTDNAKIKEWLKQKNRLLRQQKREERKLRREKRKQEAEEAKQKMAKHEKAEILFRKWVEQKEKEMRLLKKRRRKQRQDFNCSITTISSETETIDLKRGEIVNGSAAKNAVELNSDGCKDSKCVRDKNNKKIDLNIGGQEGSKCTCGFLAGIQSAGTKSRLTQQPKKVKKPAPKLKQCEAEPASTKSKTSDDENSEEKKRMSYNEWLKQKRSADMERRKREKKEQEELLAQSDPEMDSIISGMAKRRIRNILKEKKPVNTGITSIDDEANRSVDEKVSRRQKMNGRAEEITPASGSSARYYRWVPKDNNKADSGTEKRPLSAQVRSSRKRAMPKGERPASAKVDSTSVAQSHPTEGDEVSAKVEHPENHRAISPKPKVPVTKAYKDVKYQRQSWDEFSDYVWDKLNEEAGVKCDDTAENHQQREDGIKSENKVLEEAKSQSMFDVSGESVQSSSSKVDKKKARKQDGAESKEGVVQSEDDQVTNEDESNHDQSGAEQETDAKDQLPEVDRNLEDKAPGISVSSRTVTVGETDKAVTDDDDDDDDKTGVDGDDDGHHHDNGDDKEAVEACCISEVVEETIFSMTEVDGKNGNENLEADFASNIRRPSIALENIPEEIEEEVEQSSEEDSKSSSSGEQSTEESESDAVEKDKQQTEADNQAEGIEKANPEVGVAEQSQEAVETSEQVNKVVKTTGVINDDTPGEEVKGDLQQEDSRTNGMDKTDSVSTGM